MAQNDLTTISRVRGFLGSTGVADATLGLMIARVSAAMLSAMNRDSLLLRVYTDYVDGPGRQRMMLSRYPVLSVNSLSIGTQVVPQNQQPPTYPGYFLNPWSGIPPGTPQEINLSSYCFQRGLGNVCVSYLAGYGILGEQGSVPLSAPFKVCAQMPWGPFVLDYAVTYADGTPMTKVAANPSQGQYVAPAPLETCADYIFSSADAGASVKLSYSYVPDAIEGAACQFVAEQWQYRDRVGISSKSLGGQETISYIVKDLPEFVRMAIASYKNVVPIG